MAMASRALACNRAEKYGLPAYPDRAMRFLVAVFSNDNRRYTMARRHVFRKEKSPSGKAMKRSPKNLSVPRPFKKCGSGKITLSG
jgi:hypothetical protein